METIWKVEETKKKIIILAAFVLAVSTCVQAEGFPSAKATARCGDIAIMDVETLPLTTVMKSTIKTANKKDLFIDVSMQCGLYTKTRVKSKGRKVDTASAEAKVEVAVVVDRDTPTETIASPGIVVFAEREQELSAALEGMIGDCLSIDPDTNSVILDMNCVTPEEIQLMQRTMSANAFNFIVDGSYLGPGVHTIEVMAMITTDVNAFDPLADPNSIIAPDTPPVEAKASIGLGSVTIEEVRCIKEDEITELGT